MEAIYKMKFDCGRSGSLAGVFIAEKEHIDYMIENSVYAYFGEALGKHSEVFGQLTHDDIKLVTDDKKVVDLFREHDIKSGYNPLHAGGMWYRNDQILHGEEYDDMTVGEAIVYKLTGVLPKWKE